MRPWISRALVAAALGALLCQSAFSTEGQHTGGSSAGLGASEQVVRQVGPHRYAVGRLLVDLERQAIRCPGRINMAKGGPIELLACVPGGKVHESVLVLDAEPLHLQLALLLLGLEPGRNPAVQYPAGAPESSREPGDMVELYIEWSESAGGQESGARIVRRRADELLYNVRSRRPMGETLWVFTGSRWVEGRFAADMEGSLIATYRDQLPILELSLEEVNDDIWYEANEGMVPPVGTEVELIIRVPEDHLLEWRGRGDDARGISPEEEPETPVGPDSAPILSLAETDQSGRDESLALEVEAAMQRASRYLQTSQEEDGSWRHDPGITALVVTAMLRSGRAEFGIESMPVQKGLRYVRRFCKPDGGMYGEFYASYTTSICVMALLEAGRPEDSERIDMARSFLLDLQADEGEGILKDGPQYGGWGYEKQAGGAGMHRADMSNTQVALSALRALEKAEEEGRLTARAEATAGPADTEGSGGNDEGMPEGPCWTDGGRTGTGLAYKKTIRYLERCQNTDGGFIYRPGESKAGETAFGTLRSYGSMTYAGLLSMIHARLTRDDPRVTAAYNWIRAHWTVMENPGLGNQGLFYYYHTVAKTLNVYGAEVLVDSEGKGHHWRSELADRLLKVQQADGSWVNENGRWMEKIPELVTAYSVLALAEATGEW